MNALPSMTEFTSAADPRGILMAMTSVGEDSAEPAALRRALEDRGVTVQDWIAADAYPADGAVCDADVLLVTARMLDSRVSALIQKVGSQASPFVIVLSEDDDIIDRIVALELGADDFLRRDSDPREIVARARSLMRRGAQRSGRPTAMFEEELVDDACWVLNDVTRQLRSPKGGVCSLSKGDIELIDALAEGPSDVLSMDRTTTQANTLRVSISRLRSRFRKVSTEQLPIRNIWGVGYTFDAPLKRISART